MGTPQVPISAAKNVARANHQKGGEECLGMTNQAVRRAAAAKVPGAVVHANRGANSNHLVQRPRRKALILKT